MKISNNFNRLYWGAIVSEVLAQNEFLQWQGIIFKIKNFTKKNLHDLFKIVTFRGELSLKDMSSKEVVQYLEEVRLFLSENSITLSIDDDEWQRLILSCRE